jgi:hypothetical protein
MPPAAALSLPTGSFFYQPSLLSLKNLPPLNLLFLSCHFVTSYASAGHPIHIPNPHQPELLSTLTYRF